MSACVGIGSSRDDNNSGTRGTSSEGQSFGDVTGGGDSTDEESDGTGPVTGVDASTGDPAGADEGGTGDGSTTGRPGCGPECPTHALDVVFVVDNSATMGPDQLKLAVGVQTLMDQFELLEREHDLVLDLHLMVTTTDFGNPLCTPFEPEDYEPSQGAPVATACTSRLDDFVALGGDPEFTEACTAVCPAAVEPDAPFVHRVGSRDNVPGGTARQALECLLPQGLIGCGYESPLESMLQALDPTADWNTGDDPFLRPEADLAVVLLTDESDCSIEDYSVMRNGFYFNVDPATGSTAASSALCWNAGIECGSDDGMGGYSDCTAVAGGPLHDVSRYVSYLVDDLALGGDKDVMMLTLAGVPQVVSHSAVPPFEPTAGGVDDLAVRDWIDGPWPGGDIMPEEWALGVDADDKTFSLGIGPGCTGPDGAGEHSQGQPPLRIQAVCEALDAQGGPHCCMESICEEDFTAAMKCLRGLVETSV